MASSSSTSLRHMARRGNGSRGQKIDLLANHFGVNFTTPKSQYFFQYSVAITYEDGKPVEGKSIGRKILAKVRDTSQTELGSKHFAYDGQKILFTVGPLPKKELSFSVVLEDMSCSKSNASTSDANMKRPNQSKKFNVAITYAAQISVQAIQGPLQGKETKDHQDAVRVLDVILRHNAATKGCLLVGQSFFSNDAKYLSTKPFGGFQPCKGFNSSFRATQIGLSLNIDVSSTLLVKPGRVIGFLLENQEVKRSSYIDWKKAERTLKNLRIKVSHSNRECKITGLSKLSCKNERFIWKQKQGNGEAKEDEITVYDYFTKRLKIALPYSGDLPCINVGKPKRPTYIPMELCELVPLQRYTKALTSSQRRNMVIESVQNPQAKMNRLHSGLKEINYNNDPLLQECGVRIGSDFTQVEGRILTPPNLKAGNGRDLQTKDGRWNFNMNTFAEPVTVTRWAVVNFSAPCDPNKIVNRLIKCGNAKGMKVEPRFKVFEEDTRFRGAPAHIRVEKMFEQMQSEFRKEGKPKFILCILAEKKNSLVYGPWKKRNLVEEGIATQCIAPPKNVNDQYLTNVLLKINAKLGGLNSLLAKERSRAFPLVTRVPTFIIGMDVSHGSPGSDEPSIAAVVGSREWPLISKYRACVRTQSRRVEMIDNLFKPVTNENGETVDEGIFSELLYDFYISSEEQMPEHIIIFRDGVSESQFTQVLNIELNQMMEACKFRGVKNWHPKFTVIISVKRHHTRLFQVRSRDENVPPGTIVDRRICNPYGNDFYLCAHAGMLGTSRPIHYHLLYDGIGFSTDGLQELVHSLSYVYQRSTNAISQVAPVMYAHLAAAQMATAMKFEDSSETSSSHGGTGITTSGEVPVPPMPKLHANVATSMFFC